MSSNVVIQPLAQEDIRSIKEYYENIRVGLSDGFVSRLEKLLALISAHPRLYAIRAGRLRAVRIRKTPFVLYYVATDDEIKVFGILHGARDESAWKERIES